MAGKKLKILRVISRLNIGGPAVHTILLTEGLDREKFETLLVCGYPDINEGDMLYYAREKKVSPYFIPELKRDLNFHNDFSAFRKLYRIINKEKPLTDGNAGLNVIKILEVINKSIANNGKEIQI